MDLIERQITLQKFTIELQILNIELWTLDFEDITELLNAKEEINGKMLKIKKEFMGFLLQEQKEGDTDYKRTLVMMNICPICEERFRNRPDLTEHLTKHRLEEEDIL